MAGNSDALAKVDRAKLTAWMDSRGLGDSSIPIELDYMSGGSQNEIFKVTRGDWSAALRKPPFPPPPGRAEGIVREWKIIEALDGSDVPHTKAIALCEDESIMGTNFYMMGVVDGWSPMSAGDNTEDADASTVRKWPEPFESDLASRAGLAKELIRGAAMMANFDWEPKLKDLGRPDGYHERQVERWIRFYERVKSREIPGLAEATKWLDSNRPLDFKPGLMHGDYQFANVMFAHGAPTKLAAIIDWEMGTIGDPKIDLAWIVRDWPEDTSQASGASYVNTTGMPGRTELLNYWSSLTGRSVEDMDYYYILAAWKLGIVLEQGYARALQGHGDEKQMAFGPLIIELMQKAADMAASTSFSNPK